MISISFKNFVIAMSTLTVIQLNVIADKRFDVALILDESGTFGYIDWVQLRRGLEMWLDSLGAPSAIKVRFAAIGCGHSEVFGEVTPIFTFNDYVRTDSGLQLVKDTFESHKWAWSNSDNVGGCSKATVEDIFISSAGDRQDADNIFIYITDCLFDRNESDERDGMKRLVNKVSACLFICGRIKPNVDVARTQRHLDLIASWLEPDNNCIYEFTDPLSLKMRLDNLLSLSKPPLNPINDCQYKMIRTPCKMQQPGQCAYIEYPQITQYPSPNGKQCPEIRNIPCDLKECSCEKNSWVRIGPPCSESCEYESFTRDVSQNPSCIDTKIEHCVCTTATTKITTTSTTTTTKPTTTTAKLTTTTTHIPTSTTTTMLTTIKSEPTTTKRTTTEKNVTTITTETTITTAATLILTTTENNTTTIKPNSQKATDVKLTTETIPMKGTTKKNIASTTSKAGLGKNQLSEKEEGNVIVRIVIALILALMLLNLVVILCFVLQRRKKKRLLLLMNEEGKKDIDKRHSYSKSDTQQSGKAVGTSIDAKTKNTNSDITLPNMNLGRKKTPKNQIVHADLFVNVEDNTKSRPKIETSNKKSQKKKILTELEKKKTGAKHFGTKERHDRAVHKKKHDIQKDINVHLDENTKAHLTKKTDGKVRSGPRKNRPSLEKVKKQSGGRSVPKKQRTKVGKNYFDRTKRSFGNG